jgi:hypothetical protein
MFPFDTMSDVGAGLFRQSDDEMLAFSPLTHARTRLLFSKKALSLQVDSFWDAFVCVVVVYSY